MERIVIEVSEDTAKRWLEIPPKIKAALAEDFAGQINSISQKTADGSFDTALQQLREEAAKNGLTEERLQELLNED